MRSIDGPGSVSGRFVDYDAITNPNGTVYTADYGNDIQDEIIGIQELAGLTEAAGTNLQLHTALSLLQNEIDPLTAEWVNTTTYGTAGQLVRVGIKVFAATGKAGNLAKDPTAPENYIYWMPSYSVQRLSEIEREGLPQFGGLHPAHTASGADYKQNIKVFRSSENSVLYDYSIVHLDNTAVTGDLLTLLTGYKYLTEWTWDDAGTTRVKDLRGFSMRAMTATGGLDATLAEVKDGAMPKMIGEFGRDSTFGSIQSDPTGVYSGVFTKGTVVANVPAGSASAGYQVKFDNSLLFNTEGDGSGTGRTTGPAAIVGVPYIIVKKAV